MLNKACGFDKNKIKNGSGYLKTQGAQSKFLRRLTRPSSGDVILNKENKRSLTSSKYYRIE